MGWRWQILISDHVIGINLGGHYDEYDYNGIYVGQRSLWWQGHHVCRHLECDCGDEHYSSDCEGCPSQLNQGNEGQLLSPTFLGCKLWVAPKQGDTLGLLWDDGNLTVFLNGARKGILNSHVGMGMLRGPAMYCWCVVLRGNGQSVHVASQ